MTRFHEPLDTAIKTKSREVGQNHCRSLARESLVNVYCRGQAASPAEGFFRKEKAERRLTRSPWPDSAEPRKRVRRRSDGTGEASASAKFISDSRLARARAKRRAKWLGGKRASASSSSSSSSRKRRPEKTRLAEATCPMTVPDA